MNMNMVISFALNWSKFVRFLDKVIYIFQNLPQNLYQDWPLNQQSQLQMMCCCLNQKMSWTAVQTKTSRYFSISARKYHLYVASFLTIYYQYMYVTQLTPTQGLYVTIFFIYTQFAKIKMLVEFQFNTVSEALSLTLTQLFPKTYQRNFSSDHFLS